MATALIVRVIPAAIPIALGPHSQRKLDTLISGASISHSHGNFSRSLDRLLVFIFGELKRQRNLHVILSECLLFKLSGQANVMIRLRDVMVDCFLVVAQIEQRRLLIDSHLILWRFPGASPLISRMTFNNARWVGSRLASFVSRITCSKMSSGISAMDCQREDCVLLMPVFLVPGFVRPPLCSSLSLSISPARRSARSLISAAAFLMAMTRSIVFAL